MEQQITWLILTVVLNGLVTGIIVVWFGKRLESRLGRENFVHQTKFSDNYAKRVKALEGFYQKFTDYSGELYYLAANTKAHIKSGTKYKPQEYKKHRKDILTRHLDCVSFHQNNRLFFSDEANDAILGTFVTVLPVQLVIFHIASDPLMASVDDDWVELLQLISDPAEFQHVDPNNPETLLARAGKELAKLTADLERLYNSEVELKA